VILVAALLIVALILFVLAAIAWPPIPRGHLGWLGLAAATLAALLERNVL
jgi:hypothetical protein